MYCDECQQFSLFIILIILLTDAFLSNAILS